MGTLRPPHCARETFIPPKASNSRLRVWALPPVFNFQRKKEIGIVPLKLPPLPRCYKNALNLHALKRKRKKEMGTPPSPTRAGNLHSPKGI